MVVPELRQKRIAAGIAGSLVCQRAKIARSRLSDIERGYVIPRAEEFERIALALEQLIEAKSVIDRVAASVGWPSGEGR
jgi:transcriptional regulator with XRE-family HTH domain